MWASIIRERQVRRTCQRGTPEYAPSAVHQTVFNLPLRFSAKVVQWKISKHDVGSPFSCPGTSIEHLSSINVQLRASQVVLVIKNPPANAGDRRDAGLIPGSGRPPGGGHCYHSSVQAWRIPWTEEPSGLLSTGSQRIGQDWVSTHACTTSGFLADVCLLSSTPFSDESCRKSFPRRDGVPAVVVVVVMVLFLNIEVDICFIMTI